eukprot:7355208-Lingulodinium_polyedra.AAC.1
MVSVHNFEVFSGPHAMWYGPNHARAPMDHTLLSHELVPQAEWAKVSGSWYGMQAHIDHPP